jgi:hypothetical protein
VRYCGVAVGPTWQHLCSLEEVLVDEPPVRLRASFYEPGSVEQVVAQIRELGDVVVGVAGAAGTDRACDHELMRMGVAPQPFVEAGPQLFEALSGRGVFRPSADETRDHGSIAEGAFREAAVFETNADGVFAALQGRRMPARRHPFGMRRRIQELTDDRVVDDGGELWHRRAEELEAAAAALAAHRYAVGHAFWVGDRDGAIVLPGAHAPERFSGEGVVPPVMRLPLPDG